MPTLLEFTLRFWSSNKKEIENNSIITNTVKETVISNLKLPHEKSIFMDDVPTKAKMSVLNFSSYADAITGIILNSKPRYTIGIFGEWGTGKTTMMNCIKEKLEQFQCKCIEFNAWRYEREQAHATIPLILTILNSIYEEVKKNQSLAEKVLERISKLSVYVELGIPGLPGMYLYSDPTGHEVTKKQKLESTSERYLKRTTIQEGLDTIEESLKSIPKSEYAKEDLKLVVFIDDLDRCSADKAVQVLESIKILFDTIGIVFVLGLNRSVITSAINKKIEHLEGKFGGESYLKKIIQLPVYLPIWKKEHIDDLLEFLLKEHKDEEQRNILYDHKDLVAQVVETNPREVKRFLNSLILTSQIYKDQGIQLKSLLIIQAIEIRWPDFYQNFVSNPDFRQTVQEYADLPTEKRMEKIEQRKTDRRNPPDKIEQLLFDIELWQLLEKEKNIIFDIRNQKSWQTYKAATETAAEIRTGGISSSYLLSLLKKGNVEEFNKGRADNPLMILDYRGVALYALKLKGINLSRVSLQNGNLIETDLSDSKLDGANISYAALQRVNLTGSSLSRADLSHSDFKFAHLGNTDLSGANLENAEMDSADLSGANIRGADLRGATFFHADLRKSDLGWSNLENADLRLANLEFSDLRNANCKNAKFQGEIPKGMIINQDDWEQFDFSKPL